MDEDIRAASLEYHRKPTPGKIALASTKSLTNQRDLALAYTPGVAAACDEIVRDPGEARNLTARGNLVAVITNGTAVLGLGPIGPLAAKPVMEGKAVLFKKFANLDVFDIEVNELDPDKLVDIIVSLEPTFGGINLEDIKAPECFYIEKKCRERMKIPVFHDDQHGTAIIVGAAVYNGLRVVGKKLEEVKVVCSGAGAAALACLDLLVSLGIRREHVWVSDIKGVVYQGRVEEMDENKVRYAQRTTARTLADIIEGADVFLGLSAAGVLKPELCKKMARDPLIMALANPTPEILPEEARAVRPDAVIATGRSDYPNQVNNVLCFPFIFRGALDVGATTINEAMKLACVRAIADLAMAEQSEIVANAYGVTNLSFGRDYLIPKPFDPRLISVIAPAVARAAMDSGVATRPITDFAAYHQQLLQLVYHSGLTMKPVFSAAKANPKRVVYAEGEDERVLRAAQVVIDEQLAHPILIGRPDVIAMRLEHLGLRMQAGRDFELINPDHDPRFHDAWTFYHNRMERKGVTVALAQREVRRRPTLIAALLMHFGDADAMLCGTYGSYEQHLFYIENVIGRRSNTCNFAAMNMLMLPQHTVYIADTYVNENPTAEQLVDITLMATEEMQRFGVSPKVALLSHSSFGTADSDSARKMQRVLKLLGERAPQLEVEGEMHGDAALSEEVRLAMFPHSRYKGSANLLIMPTLDAANISFNLLKTVAGDNITIGPILLGAAKPAHVLTPTVTVRRIVNMTALAVVDAGAREGVAQAAEAQFSPNT